MPESLGFAQGAAVRRAMAAVGITVAGIRWLWAPGIIHGGTYEPHLRRHNVAVWNPDGFVGDNPDVHGAIPGDGRAVNSRYCGCGYRLLLRGSGGRFLPEEIGRTPLSDG